MAYDLVVEGAEEAAPDQAPWKIDYLAMHTDFSLHLHWCQVEVAETVLEVEEEEGVKADLQLAL